MPTYLYECNNCGQQFEVLQSIREDPLTICTNCGKEGIYRVVSGGIGVIFRGSGFYINDSKSSPKDKKSAPSASASKEPSPKEPSPKEPSPKEPSPKEPSPKEKPAAATAKENAHKTSKREKSSVPSG